MLNQNGKLNKCPVCQSNKIFEGKASDFEGGKYHFRPKGLKWWTLLGVVIVDDSFQACSKCGHIWSQLDPYKLTDLLERKGNTETKEKFS